MSDREVLPDQQAQSIAVSPFAAGERGGRPRPFFSPVLDLFSSIWLGVILLTLLFIYLSIGSSGVPIHPNIFDPAHWVSVRQMPAFELTEFEWFNWWPFKLLIALICINLIVATLRRIPFDALHFGVWMIHTGIITLALGSVWYFGTKVEGDAPIGRRRLIIEAPNTAKTSIPAQVGAAAVVGTGDDRYILQVASIDPRWELLSGDEKGVRAYKVTVAVQGKGGRFMRDLVADRPQYTQDLIQTSDPQQPMQRAIKALGKPLVDEAIKLSLDYDAQPWFYEVDSHALYLREVDESGRARSGWIQRPIANGLPRYNDRIAAADDVWQDALEPEPLRGEIDVAVPPGEANDPLPGVTLHVSRFLRYASLAAKWSEVSGAPINPRIEVAVSVAGGATEHYEMAAFDPQRSGALEDERGNRNMLFVWANTAEELASVQKRVDAVVRFTFPKLNKTIDETVTSTIASDPNLAFKLIEGTEYSYRVENMQDNVNFGNGVDAVAIVQIKGPQRTFRRWVFADPKFNRDLAMTDDAAEAQHQAQIDNDPDIQSVYQKGQYPPAPIVLVAGPGESDLAMVVTSPNAQPKTTSLVQGQAAEILNNVTLTVERYAPHSVEEMRPRVVPRSQRDRQVGEMMSMIRIDLPMSNDRSAWLAYHHYAFNSGDESLRRFPYRPTIITLADGRHIEMLFSRARRPLPAPVVLDDFLVDSHVGGFTGSTASILDWKSVVRFQGDDGQWLNQQMVRVNNPSEFEGWWFFQAQWDPPDAGGGGLPPSAGLNYTVLGVGNRNGVHVMLAGCIIAVLGMIYTFYGRPLIKRRRQQAVYAEVRAAGPRGVRAINGRELDPAPQPVGAAWKTPIIILLAILAAGTGVQTLRAQDAPTTAPATSFAQQVDLTSLGRVAVHTEGRVKSLESFSRAAMQFVSGSRLINDQPPLVTYFDLMLRPKVYADADLIYFKQKLMRAEVAQALTRGHTPEWDAARQATFMKSGLLSAKLIMQPSVMEVLGRMSADVLRGARFVQAIDTAMSVSNPESLRDGLVLIAPAPPAGAQEPWLPIDQIFASDPRLQTIDPALRERIGIEWVNFTGAWQNQDALAVNAAAAHLATLLPQVNPEVYPKAERLEWESWYFRNANMTWVWLFYALAMVPLLLGVVFRWRGAHRAGLLLFLVAFGAHTFAVMLRWYVSQRWPNSNMFEAITTAAWFGGCLALILELIVMRKPMRGLFALGSSVASMCAMMAVKMYPLELNADIRNMMPVLNDLWLYIHTNVIIFSYCLIFIAAVTASIYLLWRGIIALRGQSGIAEYARVGGAGSLILTRPDGSSYIDETRSSFGQILDGTTMVLMELSFVLLWTGIVMGAIWADHSWGRPWGWDPKEVFALNTFLVFLVLVHGRLKVKDKGLWTAAMALAGACVMLFNWIIINFAISGLHSYA